jgi:hypothetical protein
MNPTHRKLRRRNDIQRRKSAAGVAARERLRMERNADLPTRWPLVRSVLVCVYAAPDGRHVALRAADGVGEVHVCGSERTTRAAVSRMLYHHAIQARASIDHAGALESRQEKQKP